MVVKKVIQFIIFLTFFVLPTGVDAIITETFGQTSGKVAELTEFYRATGNVSVVSEGVGLSNPSSGTITINSIPDTATIKRAWLYWGGYLRNVTAAEMATINLNGNVISLNSSPAAELVGIEDPDGNPPVRHTYRANVLSIITAGGNDTYTLSSSHGQRDLFGASLVIVFEETSFDEGTVVISDGQAMIGMNKTAIVNGSSYASTIMGLTLSDPPNGQLTIIVSEGTAVDDNEFVFTGASSHNYGDFAANTDGKVWDDITVDVSPYLDSDTTEISSILTDLDSKGAYSHYFANIFRTSLKEGDLSEATMSVDVDDIDPGDIVTVNATIPNTGESSANETTFEITLPSNVTYISNSVQVGGVPKTDASDGDGVVYSSGSKIISVDIGKLSKDISKTLIFQVQMSNSMDDGVAATLQASVIADGIRYYTDGDGNPTDGIDRPTYLTIQGGRVINLPSGFTAHLYGDEATDLSSTRKTGKRKVRLKKGGKKVADIEVNLNDDVSIATIQSDRDDINKKAFFHGFQDIPEKESSSYTLVVPGTGTDQVRICSGAESLAQVHEGCAADYENVTEELVFTDGQTQSGITCDIISGDWHCSGVTGTGGQGEESGGEEGGGGEDPPPVVEGVPEFGDITYYVLIFIFSLYIVYHQKKYIV